MQSESLPHVMEQARRRLHPNITDPSYLVLFRRRENFERWIESFAGKDFWVLDVGGRIQPYRPLLGARVHRYIAVDTANSPLVNVRGSADALPFPADTFDLVFCTQVLEYLPHPATGIAEIHRVLKPGGRALISVASFYPKAAEEEHWRFLLAGVKSMLKPFRQAEIVPEGSSVSGFCRASAVCLVLFAQYSVIRKLICITIVPLLNAAGRLIDKMFSIRNDQATGNYSVLAEK